MLLSKRKELLIGKSECNTALTGPTFIVSEQPILGGLPK